MTLGEPVSQWNLLMVNNGKNVKCSYGIKEAWCIRVIPLLGDPG